MGFFGSIANKVKTAYNSLDERSQTSSKTLKPRSSDVKKYEKMFETRRAEKTEKIQTAKNKILHDRYENAAIEAAVKKELVRRINGRELSENQVLKLERVIAKQLKTEIAKKQKVNSVKVPNGYVNKGSYKPNEIHLKWAIANFKRDGYDVIIQPRYNNRGEEISVLYVKKNKVSSKKVKKGVKKNKTVNSTGSFTKTITVNDKRYNFARSFGPYRDDAKSYAEDLRYNGFSSRVKAIAYKGTNYYAVYTRNPARR